ncbi:MAG: alpha/beta fold hydrolase [Magnetococcales bacterium]|nr:alpha/beta fold hydrolase [Magnetococcales bacterium]
MSPLFRTLTVVVAAILSLWSVNARADLIVLVHGYLSDGRSWHGSGIVSMFQSQRWPLGGALLPQPPFVIDDTREKGGQVPEHTVFLAELPSLAPLAVQALVLESELVHLGRRHPGQPLIIVGHSAGGVVARLALVRGQLPPVRALITIAAPHLGTPRAEMALDAISDPWPLEVFKDFFVGGPYPLLRESSGLLFDLARPFPGSLLFALNLAPHPDIRYISVIRTQPFLFGDTLVPGFSQDMNRIPALAGKAEVVLVPGDHPLHPGDGMVLQQLIRKLAKGPSR